MNHIISLLNGETSSLQRTLFMWKNKHWLLSGKIPEPIHLITKEALDQVQGIDVRKADWVIQLDTEYKESIKRLGALPSHDVWNALVQQVPMSHPWWDDWMHYAASTGNTVFLSKMESTHIETKLSSYAWVHPNILNWLQSHQYCTDRIASWQQPDARWAGWSAVLDTNLYQCYKKTQWEKLVAQWFPLDCPHDGDKKPNKKLSDSMTESCTHKEDLEYLATHAHISIEHPAWELLLKSWLQSKEHHLSVVLNFPQWAIQQELTALDYTFAIHRLYTLGERDHDTGPAIESVLSHLMSYMPTVTKQYEDLWEILRPQLAPAPDTHATPVPTQYLEVQEALAKGNIQTLDVLGMREWTYVEKHWQRLRIHPDTGLWMEKQPWLPNDLRQCNRYDWIKQQQLDDFSNTVTQMSRSEVRRFIIAWLQGVEADKALNQIQVWDKKNVWKYLDIQRISEDLEQMFPAIDESTWVTLLSHHWDGQGSEQAQACAWFQGYAKTPPSSAWGALLSCYTIESMVDLLKACDTIALNMASPAVLADLPL